MSRVKQSPKSQKKPVRDHHLGLRRRSPKRQVLPAESPGPASTRSPGDAEYAALPTERTLPAAARLDTLACRDIVSLLAKEELNSVRAVRRAHPAIASAAQLAAQALAKGGRIIYVGAGTSGRLAALDAAECPPTFGTRPSQVVAIMAGGPRAFARAVEGAEDRGSHADLALARLRPGTKDVVIAIAASGVTPFTRAALMSAGESGARTVLVTCNPSAAKDAIADIVVALSVGPEVLAGSTRLKAGTATKLTLNAISTAALVASGKCYGPYMVDLKATSAKLRSRARRIVATIAGISAPEALTFLRAAHGDTKVAIVMARLGISRHAARERLARTQGRLRPVLEE